jgi:hypothetical protein
MNTDQSLAQITIATVEAHRGLIVLRSFDDSESEYFWLLRMTAPEFEQWWLEREESWWPVYPEEEEILARLFGEQPRPAREPMELPGMFLHAWAKDYSSCKDVVDFWTSLYRSKRFHHCHLCCDPDSFLVTPTGRRLYHKGYRG